MRIRNIHARVIEAGPEDIGALLDTMGQPDDRLYPPLWEPMRLDGPVAIGASGTHGTITAYEPGRLIELTFPAALPITGTHTFTVTPLDRERSLVRHEVDAVAGPGAWLLWKVVIEPVHDPVLEQVLDRLQAAVGTPPARPTVPSVYSRLLRWTERPRARAGTEPQRGLIVGALPHADDTDVVVIERRRETPADPEVWAAAIFADVPPWPEAFVVIDRVEDEVLLGTDTGPLDFRTAVRCEPERVVISGAVQIHDRRGRVYYALIRRIRPVVVRTMLNRAAHRLARRRALGSSRPRAGSTVRANPAG